MMQIPHDLDLVALTEDHPTTHFETGEPIVFRKGQIGTVVMEYDDRAVEVEFSSSDGATFAMETLNVDRLLRLHGELPHTNRRETIKTTH